jgi:hypothetical protein
VKKRGSRKRFPFRNEAIKSSDQGYHWSGLDYGPPARSCRGLTSISRLITKKVEALSLQEASSFDAEMTPKTKQEKTVKGAYKLFLTLVSIHPIPWK